MRTICINSDSSDEGTQRHMKGKQTPVPSPPKVSPATRQYYPKSLSVLDMLKMGKVVDKKSTTVITLHSFNIELMAWNKIPTTVEFVVDEQELGSGGFHTAFKATTQHPMYANTTWVVKRYLPKAKVLIQETNQNIEAHTKKAVQMHVLARNFARRLKNVMASSVDSQYGHIALLIFLMKGLIRSLLSLIYKEVVTHFLTQI